MFLIDFPDEVRGLESLAQSKYTIYFKVNEESVTLENYKKLLEEEKRKLSLVLILQEWYRSKNYKIEY